MISYTNKLLDRLSSSKSDEKRHLLHKKNENRQIPASTVWSYTSVHWLTPLIWAMFRNADQPMQAEELWSCAEEESAGHNAERFALLWKSELKKRGYKGASLKRVWLTFVRFRLFIILLAVCFNTIVTLFISGFMVRRITLYLQSPEHITWYEVVLILFMVIAQLLRIGSGTFYLTYGSKTGIRFRAAVMGFVYQKLMKMKDVGGNRLAKLIIIYGSDIYRLHMATHDFATVIGAPFLLICGTWYICWLIGPYGLIGVAVLFLSYVLQFYLLTLVSRYRRKALFFTDQRIRKTSEMISSMKLIKMYAWEETFKNAILGIRKREAKLWQTANTITSFSSSFMLPVTSLVAAVITLNIFHAAGNIVDASASFSVIACMASVCNPAFPAASQIVGEARISFERIKRCLLLEEHTPPIPRCRSKANAIEIQHAKIEYDARKGEQSFKLEKIDCNIKKGKLIGICGPLGSGKSSFINAILGRIPIQAGQIAVSGTVAYAQQQACIFNGTVEENIVFGKPYNDNWFNEVVHVCALEEDAKLFDNGFETKLGEHGINLSGGQKQRVSLARAVYSKSDIYLLDDPLSAVDAHVAQHLFHKCIKQTLHSRTVVLVTHQVQFLEFCDEILVMDNGSIVERGSHSELLALNGCYSDIIETESLSSMRDMHDSENDTSDASSQRSRRIYKTHQSTDSIDILVSPDPAEMDFESTDDTKSGVVTWDTCKAYITGAGGPCVLIPIGLICTVLMATCIFCNYSLGLWISSMNDPKVKKQVWVRDFKNIYQTLSLASLLAVFFLLIVKALSCAKVMTKSANYLHNLCIEKVIRAPMSFFESNSSGRILNRFSKDMDETDVVLPGYMDKFFLLLLLGFLTYVVAAIALPWIWTVVLPVFILLFTLNNFASVAIFQLKRLYNVSLSPVLTQCRMTAQGLSTVVTYHQQKGFEQRFFEKADASSAALFLYENSVRWIATRLDVFATMITIATTIVIVICKDSLNPSVSALTLTLCLSTTKIAPVLARQFNEVNARLTSVQRLKEYCSLAQESNTSSVLPDAEWPKNGNIQFSNVDLKYRSDLNPVLQNIHFRVGAGQKIGIVGRTGAGKSSLATAIYRLVELSNGNIYIDGVDISQIPLQTLRTRLSTVPQDPVLFNGSLRFNLDPMGLYKDHEIWLAIRQAHMKEKVESITGQLDAIIEENGSNFSVGERQLLCLARVILRKNKILILDEATASIDTATDVMIQQTIRENFSKCTVLIIAHRLNTVLQCNKVFVMDAGQIVEYGRPQSLLADEESVFNRMVVSQGSFGL